MFKKNNKYKKIIKRYFNKVFLETNNQYFKEISTYMIELIKKHSDIFEIAENLNLRPIKVLRNYKEYKEIYNQLSKESKVNEAKIEM